MRGFEKAELACHAGGGGGRINLSQLMLASRGAWDRSTDLGRSSRRGSTRSARPSTPLVSSCRDCGSGAQLCQHLANPSLDCLRGHGPSPQQHLCRHLQPHYTAGPANGVCNLVCRAKLQCSWLLRTASSGQTWQGLSGQRLANIYSGV